MLKILFIISLFIPFSSTAKSEWSQQLIDSTIAWSCAKPHLARAILKVESNYKNVISSEGSIGLMQVKYQTAQWIQCPVNRPTDLLDPIVNITCACKYIDLLYKKYRSLDETIISYNAGSPRICKTGTLQPSGKSCIIGQYINQSYLHKVKRNL